MIGPAAVRMSEIPALMPVRLATQVLLVPTAEAEAAIAVGELPVVYRGRTPYVASRQLLVEMGVPPDHPDLPPGEGDASTGVAAC